MREIRTFKSNQKKQKHHQNKQEIDDDFVHLIAPIGGIAYHPEFVRKGDGYECVIYVHQFTETVRPGWLNRFKLKDVIINLSVYPQEKIEVEQKIERSLNEQLSRYHNPKTETLEQIKAKRQIGELNHLVEELDGAGEVVFKVAIRLYLFKPTFAELEEKVGEVLLKLRSYSFEGTILMNEQDNEFKHLFRPSDKDIVYRRYGKAMPALTFGAGFPFLFSQLSDPRGIPLGTTEDGGSMILDLFHLTDTRSYYIACIFGLMRSGKSTLIKKLIKNFAIVGHRIRSLDPVGETVEVAEMFGGRTISLDGKHDVLNPLDHHGSLEASLAKAETFLSYIAPALDPHEISIFSGILRQIYQIKLPKHQQPLFSDILNVVSYQLKNNALSDNRRKQMENLETQLDRIVHNYGSLFDRPSSINTFDEDIVVYTLRNLTTFGKEVYQAQMFNILSLLWQELIVFGSEQKKGYEEGRIDIKDVRPFVLFADEAHHFLSSSNIKGVEFLVTIEREARKYFGGFIWASQSIRDAVSATSNEAVTELIKTLFELTQYKFMMKQDANAIGLIANIFNNQMTEAELSQIQYFKTGDVLLNISGDANYKFRVHASEEELALFKGGR